MTLPPETTLWEDIKGWYQENREPVIVIVTLSVAIGFCLAVLLMEAVTH